MDTMITLVLDGCRYYSKWRPKDHLQILTSWTWDQTSTKLFLSIYMAKFIEFKTNCGSPYHRINRQTRRIVLNELDQTYH
jgi:hypothetical protein